MIKKIKTKKLVAEAGSFIGAAEIFGIDERAVYQWKKNIPELRAYQLREYKPDIYYAITGK